MIDLSGVRRRARDMSRADRELHSELIAHRRARGLSQKDIADVMGVPVKKVEKLERYDSDPRTSTLRRYANAIGVTIQHTITLDAPEGESHAS